jgi:hypothetical protein
MRKFKNDVPIHDLIQTGKKRLKKGENTGSEFDGRGLN